MVPPPPAAGVADVLVLLPPHAESTRARQAAPAMAVTQRARTVLPRMNPPQMFQQVCGQSIGTQGSLSARQGCCVTEWCPQRYQMESWSGACMDCQLWTAFVDLGS